MNKQEILEEINKTKEEAIESIQEVSGYIKDFIFIEGQELKLTLER